MELKFRAYDPAKEEFIYSDKVAGGMWRFFKELEDKGIRHFESELNTGVSDNKGKQGYLNDIAIEINNNLWVIAWIKTDARFALLETFRGKLTGQSKNMRYLGDMVIKGNAHQNPELIEVKR